MPTPEAELAATPPSFGPGPFEFARRVAAELSTAEVRLPSFPDVVARVRQVLDDERAAPAQVARVLAADAALAARVLRIANSATFNPGGKPVTELAAAVARLGHELVRCVAVSFATQQMRQFGGHEALRVQLQELWRKGTLVAALSCVLARETQVANPDEALVAGLLHNVGRLYLVTRAHEAGEPIAADPAWDQVVQDWHPRIGCSILEHWKFPEPIRAAVAEQQRWAVDAERAPLAQVLICAVVLVPCVWYRDLLPETVRAVGAFGRLGLSDERCNRLLADSAEPIRQLRDALSGG
ncbi:MAG: HDOD domain-containing protein [Steroidobacteraceae bacterium]|jgi:HD-like signal output (HDOD) protein|nr:HDOD domain-containing protein [Steroidobacteraceae bacterium]